MGVGRPKLFRDPVHDQISYAGTPLAAALPDTADERLSWVVRRLINAREFQRLRHIRQNGLANMAFHGAEHSRFSHSMGAAHVAGLMYDRINRNMGLAPCDDVRLATTAAALIHDVGHGPFSHTLEEILPQFKHERMTQRFIEEPSDINSILNEVDPQFPRAIAGFVMHSKRHNEHWAYRIVSSQLDADRIDYLLRDALCAGVTANFDVSRLLQMLLAHSKGRIAVDRRATEAVEGYILALDQMYRVMYFHHTVRAATCLFNATVRRAFDLFRDAGASDLMPDSGGEPHPLRALFEKGQAVELMHYSRLGEFQIWTLIESWQRSSDGVLRDLSNRLMRRVLPKSIDVEKSTKVSEVQSLIEKAKDAAIQVMPGVDRSNVDYYVMFDEQDRTSYKLYDWSAEEDADESIWMIGPPKKPRPIEQEDSSIVTALKNTRHFNRLVFPEEIRARLLEVLQ